MTRDSARGRDRTARPSGRLLVLFLICVFFFNFLPTVKKSFNIHVSQEGVVQSPGFPGSSYPPNVKLQWLLRAKPGNRVRLDFHTLILEEDCQRDFIRIYDSLAPIEDKLLSE